MPAPKHDADESTSGLQLDPLDALLYQCLQAPVGERDVALERLCAAQPAQADALRRRFDLLRDLGLTPPAPERQPEHIGEYRLVRRLGEGGMGVVFLAEQPRLQRQVALKLVRNNQLPFGSGRERFRREALALSRLQHPAICPIYDFGEADGSQYLAMRYVEGETLAARLARERASSARPRPREQSLTLLAIVEKVARALHAAHEAGLIHRDVKPGNIMLTPEGEPIVLDFGLARDESSASGASLTLSGDQVGTPAYMSPEQVEGRGRKPDRRTDVYSLAVTLYEALTLRLPFQGQSREELYREILTSAPSLSSRDVPGMPRDLRVVLEKALSKEREQRYATAQEFAEDVRRVRCSEPIRARPAGPWLRLRRWSRRNPVAATFLVGLTAALCGAVALLRQLEREQASTLVALRHSRALGLAGASAEAATSSATLSLLLAREAVRLVAIPETISQLHTAVAGAREVAQFHHGTVVYDAVFAPDGNALLVCADDRTATLHSRQGDRWIEGPLLAGHEHEVRTAAFSPSGDAVATWDGDLRLWNLRGELLASGADSGDGAKAATGPSAHRPTLSPVAIPPAVTFSVDGRWVAGVDTRGPMQLFHRQEEGWVRVATPERPSPSFGLGALAPAGDRLALAFLDPDSPAAIVRVFDTTGALQQEFRGHTDYVRSVRFSADGSHLLTGAMDGTARLWRLADGGCVNYPHDELVRDVHFAPDGVHLVTSSGDRTARVWDYHGNLVALTHHEATVGWAEFSPDSSRLVVCAGQGPVRVQEREGRVLAELRGHEATVSCAHFSPDGELVLTAGWDGTARLWRLDGPDLVTLRGHSGAARSVDVAADGRLVTAGFDRTVRLWDPSGKELRRLDYARQQWQAYLSPHGDRVLAISNFAQLTIRTLADDRQIEVAGLQGSCELARFSPDGEYIAAGLVDGTVRILDPDGIELRSIPSHQDRIYGVIWLPDGRLATAGWDGAVRLWTEGGEKVREFAVASGTRLQWLAGSRDGKRLAATTSDRRAMVWNVADGSVAAVFERPEAVLTSIEFSPDGALLVTASADAARVWTIAGELRATLGGHRGDVYYAVFHPDGERILTCSGDGTVKSWAVRTDDLLQIADRRAIRPLTAAERQRYAQWLGPADAAGQ